MIEVDQEEEKRQILRRYRKLLRHSKPFLKDGDAKQIKKAFNTSLEAHKEMRRKSGEPYIYHPLEVAQICVEEIGLGTTSIVSALLHDVVEDTDVTLRDIKNGFGPKVATIIDGLTKISGVSEHGTSQQAENFRKMLLTLSEDLRVILIKLADRLHNMRTLESMPRHKQLKIASETIYLYAPLAHRLGLYAIKSELEDLYLKYTDRDTYLSIAQKIRSTKAARNRFINSFIAPIKELLVQNGFKNDEIQIKGRPKSIYSIWNKMKRQNVPFEEVYDLFAIRITVDTPIEDEKADCWKIYSIVTDCYTPNPKRLRDWVSTPKANGYESLHTTVMSDKGMWVEVQVRTKRMDDIAEKGYAAHWKYKESANKESGLEEWIRGVRDMIEQNNLNALEFVDDFRSNFFDEEVFVFTPKGDLITLPQGATSLDFAFDIHTEIGSKCIGAKINNKLQPINYRLKSGDQIEILTSAKQKPKEDWLKVAVTSKARAKIKEALKEDRKSAAIDGKEILMRKLKKSDIVFSSELVNQMIHYFNTKTALDLYYNIGTGLITAGHIKAFKEHKQTPAPKKTTKRAEVTTESKDHLESVNRTVGNDFVLIGDDMQQLDYKFASCCNPIPGDDVFGFVTVGDGIKIHRTNCSNAIELMSNYGYRVVKARWNSHQKYAFTAELKIKGIDRMGMINDISQVVSNDLQVNMRSFNIETDGGIFEGTVLIFINDTKHLEMLREKLEKLEGIINVTRLK